MNLPKTSHWNYRVVCTKKGTGENLQEVYTINEVYYSSDNKPVATTETPCYPEGSTLEELFEDMKFFIEALVKPVLKYPEDFA